MTTRRQLLYLGSLAMLTPWLVCAQARPPRIGILSARPLAGSFYAAGVVKRLEELGYRNYEYRSVDGNIGRYPGLARELVEAKCDLMFAIGPVQPALALRDAQSRAPVVFLAVDYDPVEKGVVPSLSRPGGNITGIYVPQAELAAKRMQIMLEVAPGARRLLVFADVYSLEQLAAVRKAAEAARVELTTIEYSKPPYDYEAAFESGRKAGAQAFVGLASPVLAADTATLSALLVKYRLPGAGSSVPYAEAGFLLSYGADVTKVPRRAAEIGDRVLKGAKPGAIPVEQADEFVLAINGRTARMLAIKIPESVLARATRIIE
ncbi:MAG TPA: ABC transporter substrate-binding protein [Burkholderiales bacterium]|nr:ABC transporter substrate-binding protein [Burkholderiales bacterium]